MALQKGALVRLFLRFTMRVISASLMISGNTPLNNDHIFAKLPLLAESISNADRITVLQDQVEALAKKLHDATTHMHVRAAMAIVNPIYPITQVNVHSEEDETFKRNLDELSQDIVARIKAITAMIDMLPMYPSTIQQFRPAYTELSRANANATEHLGDVIKQAENLLEILTSVRKQIIQDEVGWLQNLALDPAFIN